LVLGKLPSEMMAVGATDIAWLKAFNEFEPFGQQQDHWQTGLICSVLSNINRPRGSAPAKPEDFMPKRPTAPQSAAEVKAVLNSVGVRPGG